MEITEHICGIILSFLPNHEYLELIQRSRDDANFIKTYILPSYVIKQNKTCALTNQYILFSALKVLSGNELHLYIRHLDIISICELDKSLKNDVLKLLVRHHDIELVQYFVQNCYCCINNIYYQCLQMQDVIMFRLLLQKYYINIQIIYFALKTGNKLILEDIISSLDRIDIKHYVLESIEWTNGYTILLMNDRKNHKQFKMIKKKLYINGTFAEVK